MDVDSIEVSEVVVAKNEKSDIDDRNHIENHECEMNLETNVHCVVDSSVGKTSEANECECDVNISVANVHSISTRQIDSSREICLPKTVDDKKISSLGAIAIEYDNSESDTEDDDVLRSDNCSQEISNNTVKTMHETCEKDYRTGTAVTLGSDSDDSTSSDDSTPVDTAESDDSNDSDNENVRDVRARCKGESRDKEINSELDALPPIEDLKISMPEVLCDPLGEVAWIVDRLVVVKPKPDKPTLNLDTVLFVDKGQRALGRIYDVFGQVAEPHYCVRFNSSDHVKESDVKVNMTVYYCPNTPYTSLVFLHELTKMKASDGVGDDEPPEFSDDEEERAYYASLKQKQLNERWKGNEDPKPHKKRRTADSSWQSNHPWNRNTKFQGGRRDSRNGRNRYIPGQNWNSTFQFYQNQYWPPDERQMHPTYEDHYGYSALQFASSGVSFGSPARLSSIPPSAATLVGTPPSNPPPQQHLTFSYENSSTIPGQRVSSWSMPPPPPPPPPPATVSPSPSPSLPLSFPPPPPPPQSLPPSPQYT